MDWLNGQSSLTIENLRGPTRKFLTEIRCIEVNNFWEQRRSYHRFAMVMMAYRKSGTLGVDKNLYRIRKVTFTYVIE